MAKRRKQGGRGKQGVSQREILLLLAEKGEPMTVYEMGDALGLHRTTVHHHLRNMQNKEKIEQTVSLVENDLDKWNLKVYELDKDAPTDYRKKQNLEHMAWINVWAAMKWPAAEDKRLSETSWYKDVVEPYLQKSFRQACYQNEFSMLILKIFEIMHSYPELWNQTSFKFEKGIGEHHISSEYRFPWKTPEGDGFL